MGNDLITPIQHLDSFSKKNDIYIKRDDLLPFSFGGNKARIAKNFIKDMKHNDYDSIITYGSSKSNLSRVMSNLCQKEEIPCYIVSKGNSDSYNSKLVEMYGTEIIKCNQSNVAKTINNLINKLKSNGLNPYYIYGNIYGKGNEKVAVEPYNNVYYEIKEQEKDLNVNFDYIFLACGTGMTLSGLLSGLLINKDQKTIIGISIARTKEQENKEIKKFINSYFERKIDDFKLNNIINVMDNFLLDGYGTYNYEIVDLIKMMMIKEGIPMDPVYTGKAFWGMKKYLKKNKINEKNILFIHTGGLPLFFDLLNEI